MRVPFLDLEEGVGEPTHAIGRGDQGLERQSDQNRAGARRATLRLFLGSFGGPIDDVPELSGDGFAKTSTFLIEREDPTGPVDPVPIDAAGRQEPCDMHPGLQQRPTRWGVALGEAVIQEIPITVVGRDDPLDTTGGPE